MIQEFLLSALREDWGRGDLFSRVAQDLEIKAEIVAKSEGIFSGEVYLKTLCEISALNLEFCKKDAQDFQNREVLAKISGSYIQMLKIERIALNILQHSSGIATHTRRFVQEVGDLPIRLLDTRKTRPLLRELEKYSVRNGGASNHRFGLDDALMLKDTHLAGIEDLKTFITKARKSLPFTCRIEVECESLEMCQKAFQSGADIVMCDNMSPSEVAEVVRLRNAHYPHILLEASGNLELKNLKEYALSGVDALSSGSLIHQATWLDMSMRVL